MWGQSNSHLRAAQSSNALRTVAQSPKEPLPQTVLHPPMAQGWMWFPHNKGILSNETVKIDRGECVCGSGSCALCKHDSAAEGSAQRWMTPSSKSSF